MPAANKPAAIRSAPQSNSAYVQLVGVGHQRRCIRVAAACSDDELRDVTSRQLIGGKIDGPLG